MKKCIPVLMLIVLLLVAVLAACGTAKPGETISSDETMTGLPQTEEQTERSGVIVIFFSCTGNTKPIAEYIRDELDADIYEIKAKVPYTDEDIRYDADTRAYKEQHDPAARPEISGELPDLSAYDTVYLGYPIWHGEAPKIVYTFLEGVDMSGKTVIPFCTSAESPLGASAENLHPLAPDAVWRDGTRFAIGTTEEEIADWLGR